MEYKIFIGICFLSGIIFAALLFLSHGISKSQFVGSVAAVLLLFFIFLFTVHDSQ